MREKLDELARLHAAATKGEWDAQTSFDGAIQRKYLRRTYEHAGALLGRDEKADSDTAWIAAIHNAFPGLLEYVRELEGERDRMHAVLSDIYYRSIPMGEDSGHSTISHIAADAMRGKNSNPLAARDAQQRREGVAEWLEAEVRQYEQLFGPNGDYRRSLDGLFAEAKRLREEK